MNQKKIESIDTYKEQITVLSEFIQILQKKNIHTIYLVDNTLEAKFDLSALKYQDLYQRLKHSYDLPNNLDLKILIELTALNFIFSQNKEDLLKKHEITDSQQQEIMNKVIHNPTQHHTVSNDDKLFMIHNFLNNLSKLKQKYPNLNCIQNNFAQMFHEDEYLIQYFNYINITNYSLQEYLNLQMSNIKMKLKIFNDSSSCLNSPIEKPNDQDITNYINNNIKVLKTINLNVPLESVLSLSLGYPFPHNLLIFFTKKTINQETEYQNDIITIESLCFFINKKNINNNFQGIKKIILSILEYLRQSLNNTNFNNFILDLKRIQIIPLSESITKKQQLTIYSKVYNDLLMSRPQSELSINIQNAIKKLVKKTEENYSYNGSLYSNSIENTYSFNHHPNIYYNLKIVPGNYENRIGTTLSINMINNDNYSICNFSVGFQINNKQGIKTIEIVNIQNKSIDANYTSNSVMNDFQFKYKMSPFIILIELLKIWAQENNFQKIKIIYGCHNLWLNYHQNKNDPNKKYAKIAQQTGLTEKDETGFYLDLNTPFSANITPEILQIFQNSLKNLKNINGECPYC